ncbi:MAG: hypothetical protein ABW034_08910 [Steroidobacteraceae bacterium]
MKVIGRDEVVWYDESHLVRQTPGKDRKWQDSNWLHWWDDKNKVGGVHRMGHEYNIEGGPKVAAWSNLITPKGIYRHVVYLPLRESDKMANGGWGGGDDTARVEIIDGMNVWTIDDKEAGVSAKLNFRDYHTQFRGFPGAGRTAEDIAPHHIDVGGSVKGTITMQGTAFEADGFGERDHGWGHRDLYTMLSHRYAAGCFGPDLVYNCWIIHNGVSNSIEGFGWIVRDDTIIFAKECDIVAYTEVDSASTRGGKLSMKLANGELFESELTAVAPGLMNYFHNMPNNNTLCRVAAGNRQGTGMLETSMNYHQGNRVPDLMVHGITKNGFYPAAEVKKVFIQRRTL